MTQQDLFNFYGPLAAQGLLPVTAQYERTRIPGSIGAQMQMASMGAGGMPQYNQPAQQASAGGLLGTMMQGRQQGNGLLGGMFDTNGWVDRNMGRNFWGQGTPTAQMSIGNDFGTAVPNFGWGTPTP